jgi:hypothetical protein
MADRQCGQTPEHGSQPLPGRAALAGAAGDNAVASIWYQAIFSHLSEANYEK